MRISITSMNPADSGSSFLVWKKKDPRRMYISNDQAQLMIQLALHDRGVIPLALDTKRKMLCSLRKQLATLSPEEQKIAKRKFRKLHRKAAKALVRKRGAARSLPRLIAMNGRRDASGTIPLPRHHAARNTEVNLYFFQLALEGKL